jgi:hypothetical protein
VHGHPTLGVQNAKPRLSSRPGQKIGKLSEEYLGIRNRQMDLKAKKAAMELAAQRGELVSRALIEKQSAFLLISLRQKILAVPDRLARQLVNVAEVKKAKAILKDALLVLLTELADLPSKVTNPRWLDEVAAEEKDADEGK